MASSRYEVEVIITSAKDLKNINWRHGPLRPYAVVWIDPNSKFSTLVDEEGDTCPNWNQTLVIPFNDPIEDATLHLDIVHANAAEDTKPLIGSARLRLRDVVDDYGLGAEPINRKLDLKRPSGRPQGKLEIRVAVRQPRYRTPEPSYAAPYGVPATKDYYGAPPAYGTASAYGGPAAYGYGAPPAYGYGAAPTYGAPSAYNPSYGAAPVGVAAYGQGQYVEEGKKKKSGMGMGTGLAVGAVAGVLGGLALAEGVDYVEDKIEDDVADQVEDDLGYDDGDF